MSRRKQSRRRSERDPEEGARNRLPAAHKRNKEDLATTLDWLLSSDTIFSDMKLHGNTKWHPKSLICLAFLWAWSGSKHVTDAYSDAVACYQSMCDAPIPGTYQGFMGALTTWTQAFIDRLWPLMQQRMQEVGGKFWRIGGWVPIAFDGSRSSAPRSKANEEAFCAKNYGKGKTARYRKKKSKGMRRKKNEKNKPQPQEPQAWITMMWHMGLRLPWSWRLGPSNASERGHVMEMLDAGKYPTNTLFCGDAGFVGYAFWSAIINSGSDFLIRVGSNVSLLAESIDYELLDDRLVLCWPKAMQRKQPPLRLRLVKLRLGTTDACLLTSVLDATELTSKQMLAFYKLRWGVEVEFRGLKQTLDRRKLRCHNHKRLLAELNWSIMAMAVAELLALKEQLTTRSNRTGNKTQTATPAKRSLANTMRVIRRCMRDGNHIPEPGQDLPTLLRNAVTDSYARRRPKRARYRPPNPDKGPMGIPKMRNLTAQEKEQLRKTTPQAIA